MKPGRGFTLGGQARTGEGKQLSRPAPRGSGWHHEGLSLFQARNPSSSAKVKAFESRHGIGKPQRFFDLPILEQAVNESSMEDIACAGGIYRPYLESFSIEEFSVDQGHGAQMTQSGEEKSMGLFLKFEKSFF